MSISILVVDDDRGFCTLAAAALVREGFEVATARSLHETRELLRKSSPSLVFLDRRLPDGDGLQFLPELRAQAPDAQVMMVTAFSDIASVVDAVRAGATDYLVKPVELADLVMKARRTHESRRLNDRLAQAEAELVGRHRLSPPRSPAMRAVIDMVERIAAVPRRPVLLLGETGSGKEVVARYLHHLRVQDGALFVHVNCAALPASTFESELFGHERGAFTDADRARRGLVEVAHGGTLFLDEIGELPPNLQAKLLTFLDAGSFRRLAATTESTSSARVVAATNRDLTELIGQGKFREDLYFRLSTFRIEVPPLRQRREDILPLAQEMVDALCLEMGRRPVPLSEAARARLLAYRFPGNVRELRNILERALALRHGGVPLEELPRVLELAPLPAAGALAPAGDYRELKRQAVDRFEREYLVQLLREHDGNVRQASRASGIERMQLKRLLRKHGLL
jgi:two-component system response regulator AtoC